MSGWAAAIGGGLQLAGGLYQNRQSEQSAKVNRQFQERMVRNAYQYAMEDMKKAGLNPMLAFSQGGSKPVSGAMPNYENVASGVTNSAVAAATAIETVKNMREQNRNIAADTELKDEQAMAQRELSALYQQQTANATQDYMIKDPEVDFMRDYGNLYVPWMKGFNAAGAATGAIGGAVGGAIRGVKKLMRGK